MIEKTLEVTSVNGNQVTFSVPEPKSCEGCNGRCGSQVFGKLFGNRRNQLTITITTPVEPGQKVRLSFDDSQLVSYSLWLYMTPLAFGFTGLLTSALLFSANEFVQLISALGGGAIGAYIAKQQLKRKKQDIVVEKIYPKSLSISQINGD